jgi:hypothetical protein
MQVTAKGDRGERLVEAVSIDGTGGLFYLHEVCNGWGVTHEQTGFSIGAFKTSTIAAAVARLVYKVCGKDALNTNDAEEVANSAPQYLVTVLRAIAMVPELS